MLPGVAKFLAAEGIHGAFQVQIMSHKVEEDYNKKVEQEQNERTQEQLLEALDKIRAPICVCEIGQADTKILFANHTWTTLAGAGGRLTHAIKNPHLTDHRIVLHSAFGVRHAMLGCLSVRVALRDEQRLPMSSTHCMHAHRENMAEMARGSCHA